MSISERIRFLRQLRGMTQKVLGLMIGFPSQNADVRIAQYEMGNRTPKSEYTKALAQALDVSPNAIDIPPLETRMGLMHTLFALEDIYGLRISPTEDAISICPDRSNGKHYADLVTLLNDWREQAVKLHRGEITKEQYDQWRYCYPDGAKGTIWAKVPSDAISELIAEAGKSDDSSEQE